LTETAVEIYNDLVASLTAEAAAFALREVDVKGHKLRVYVNTPRNLPAIFATVMTVFPDRVLVHEENRETTYAETFERAKRLAGALQDDFGVQPGQPVGLAMANSADWLVSFIAITWIGAIAVLLNSRGAADELRAAVEDVGTPLVIADGRRAKLILDHDGHERIIVVDDGTELVSDRLSAFADLLTHPQAEAVDLDPDEPAAILFTSGTTGRPKGAVLTHRNLTAMVENLKFLSTINIMSAARTYGIEVDVLRQMMPLSSCLLVFPLFHISGVTSFFMTMLSGGKLTMLRRWWPETALQVIAANKVTMLSGPPLVVTDLLEQENAVERMASLNSVAVGGQATPASIITRLKRALPMASQSVGWGSTEVSGTVASAAGATFAARPNSCGLPSPLIDMRVVDEAGADVPPGQSGEIWLRGVLVTPGYWNKPEATAAAFSGEWFKSGDIGFIDPDGFVHLIDRKKDMVICGGENIYCAEVERVLSADEAFVEVALFGVPDERLGERAVAAVVLRDGFSRSEDEIKGFVRASLADYKVPSAVDFELGPFPRNVTGKVNKAKLRSAYLERLKEAV
jgi:acyl-CoA synthetase (AMP-forming)/AMP-acid ligase II